MSSGAAAVKPSSLTALEEVEQSVVSLSTEVARVCEGLAAQPVSSSAEAITSAECVLDTLASVKAQLESQITAWENTRTAQPHLGTQAGTATDERIRGEALVLLESALDRATT